MVDTQGDAYFAVDYFPTDFWSEEYWPTDVIFIEPLMAVWPASLPAIPLVAGFSESPPDVLIRTQMDAGPARVRPRYTGGVRPIMAAISCTKAQVETLDVFYVDTLLQGSQPFDWVSARTGVAKSLRFTKPPVYKPEHQDRWTVTLELEILP